MIRGSRLRGSVRYEIGGTLGQISHCHCSQCRKAHGAAFGSYARVDTQEFKFVAGVTDIRSYASSPGVHRTFCARCGATLQFVREDRPDAFWIAVGTLDDDPGVRATHHIYVGSRAPWYEIVDALPQFEQQKAAAG